jgi:hypothetical protein
MQNHDTVASLKRRGHQQVLQKSRVYGAGRYPEGERKRIFRSDRISGHVGAFEAIGVPALLVPDSTRGAVIKACRPHITDHQRLYMNYRLTSPRGCRGQGGVLESERVSDRERFAHSIAEGAEGRRRSDPLASCFRTADDLLFLKAVTLNARSWLGPEEQNFKTDQARGQGQQ